jgi:hypothetical protein
MHDEGFLAKSLTDEIPRAGRESTQLEVVSSAE